MTDSSQIPIDRVKELTDTIEELNGRIETLSSRLSVLESMDYIVEQGEDENKTWYKLYKSGWLVQGGVVTLAAVTANWGDSNTVLLLKNFKDTSYNAIYSDTNIINGGYGTGSIPVKTVNTFRIRSYNTNATQVWFRLEGWSA